MEMKRVVVTGLGTINPIGNSVPEYWANLEKGVSGSELITSFDASKFKTKFACQVKNFDPNAYFDRKELKKIDPYTQFALVAVEEAMKDSGLNTEAIDLDMAGVVWASGIGGMQTFTEELRGYFAGDGTPRFSPYFIPRMISDIAAGYISIKYGFRGPNFSTVSACASSTNGIISALDIIRTGKANVIIAGGSEASVNEVGVGGFNSMQAMSTNNDEYKTASRPFDVTRDGFVIGEGGGCIILEEYEHAKARGAKIYCELKGGGMSADAYHLTAPHPEGLGARKVMENALKDADLTIQDIDYINVHGTATPLGDIAEAKAIISVFGDYAFKLNISSTKSMTGHLLGAAGAIEAIAAIFAICTDTIPPTINFKSPDPEIDSRLNITPNSAQKRSVKAALSNTFGFGGHNASIIFQKI
ncbi:MAG TPA: beta-ketoacyl-ACP synthase II [Tenuifilaceae bacterium]|mgnify:CR=1 FL=1|jgi:3-oxoacyl-[acyl-carrier-protein] synthase II|nr:beta-ketoacyl-ACP synthase II [Bacteroidales bacterium]HNT41325.1 beta-ketoacyl-ACP synthase II [Tenuifilaceae bacterium]HNY08321.1 beta-ketoacyl-ACP synthase II [Tenuifilaceae bacterium]HOA10259.1 beta-ketoacyl-ACP synthase II [Tenuifilaceae bacterium]HOC36256.1 beta-ketoacyl-ACP synthase II [Tenuifilaceae bacterium]